MCENACACAAGKSIERNLLWNTFAVSGSMSFRFDLQKYFYCKLHRHAKQNSAVHRFYPFNRKWIVSSNDPTSVECCVCVHCTMYVVPLQFTVNENMCKSKSNTRWAPPSKMELAWHQRDCAPSQQQTERPNEIIIYLFYSIWFFISFYFHRMRSKRSSETPFDYIVI